ncbi:transcription factor IIB [Trypanosoma conorhini]|uniref:Transcription factor IIB n=1 Tax=Trypanosoma conorhini TaxID=83891 RepID=A0A422Q5Z9_9TRYP|nr:transcription factor IIB [Trypanosoma conorhini]RNF25374.1 transcription factor IIB [Trypanosoma conorhini]
MATTADFVGRNCPHCGAIDSLETDDALGEVACTECALVVAMGLEENALTRYDKDATYEDADKHRAREDTTASTLHALSASSSAMGPPGGDMLPKVALHPAMLNCIRSLQKKSGVPEQAIGRAVNIARRFVGGRRARGQRVGKQQDVAAACFMIAAEQLSHPVPMLELRQLDPAIGNVEYPRAEIVKETHMEDEELRLKAVYVDNLLTVYLRKLSLQLSLYMPRCKRLLEAVQRVDALRSAGVVDKIVMSLLLTLTSPSFEVERRPPLPAARSSGVGRGTETVYANFAAKAHLDVGKVKRVMQTALQHLQAIEEAFAATTASAEGARTSATKIEADDNNNRENNPTAPATKRMKLEKP